MGIARRLVVLGALLATVAGACGGGGGGGEDAHPSLPEVGPRREPVTIDAVPIAATTLREQQTAHVTYRFEFDGRVSTIESDVDLDLDREVSSVLDTSTGQVVEVTADGSTSYVRRGGGGWARIDARGALAEQPVSILGTDPIPHLEALADARGVKEEEGVVVHGTASTRFSATIDGRRALEAAGYPPDLAALGDQVLARAEVYLDNLGRVVRLTSIVGTVAGTFRLTIDFTDFGDPLELAVPPPEAVTRTLTASSPFELQQRIAEALA
jgi:hypothetical protein